jgi:hypothetical protein
MVVSFVAPGDDHAEQINTVAVPEYIVPCLAFSSLMP